MGKVIFGYNDLLTQNPELASEWHPTKNGELTPDCVAVHSGKKFWWLGKCGHEWDESVSNRSKGHGCPYCSNHRVLKGFNDITTINPKLTSEWHPTKNGDLRPDMLTSNSNKKVWWQCAKGHEWQAQVSIRNQGSGCPYCSGLYAIKGETDLVTTNPELTSEWHPTKNGILKPDMFKAGSGKNVWWRCFVGHEWQTTIAHRSEGNGCPYCVGKKVLKGYNDLTTKNPELVAEWHPTKNGDLAPDMVTAHSCKKVWWLGSCGHEWDDTIAHRSDGRGCPYCSNHRALKGYNDFVTKNPELAKEWHPTKNGDLKPDMVTVHSHKKVWWLGLCGHEWQALISDRSNGNGCPFCSGRQVLKGFNDLATNNPKLAKEWHSIKNGSLSPEMFTAGSNEKVWWKCAKGHEWQAIIADRSGGNGCPICNQEKQTSFAEQAIFFYLKQVFSDSINRDKSFGKELDIYIPSIQIAIEYDGSYYHKNTKKDEQKNEWCRRHDISLIRIRERDCPVIVGCEIIIRNDNDDKSLKDAIVALMNLLNIHDVIINIDRDRNDIYNAYIIRQKEQSLVTINPELAKEWHPTKNGSLTPDMVMPGSKKKVWWQCSNGHEWQAPISSRSKGVGCPYCSGNRASKGFNDLATINPKLASEWHSTKNGDLTPNMVTASSGKKVWWQCSKGHEWQATVANRNNGNGCPCCAGQITIKGENDLVTANPKLASEWHPTKNGKLTPDCVTTYSNKKVWWLGKCGHEWDATINHRSNGRGCPYCAGKRILKGYNDLATKNPEFSKEWHPTKNGDLTPDMVTAGSSKKVWWLGLCGHEWQARIADRNKGRGCPYCAHKGKK